MNTLLLLLPLIAIMVLLIRRQHMLVAGAAGGILAILIGGIPLADAGGIFTKGAASMLAITTPILYAAAAMMVGKAGSIKAAVTLAKRGLGKQVGLLAAFMVLIQAAASYMAGMGAGNTMVTAPLVFAAVGAVPPVIAGMAIATAASFTTSPASTETIITAQFAGVEVTTHANGMMPYTALFWIIGMALAYWGVRKYGSLVTGDAADDEMKDVPAGKLWIQAIPFISLLTMVILGGKLNGLLGVALFTPGAIVLIATLLTFLCSKMNLNESFTAFVEGSRFILVTLFEVGLFLGFINMMGEIGTFKAIAGLAGAAPASIIAPVAAIIAFVVAIPSGAMAAGVLALIMPTIAAIGVSPAAMGLVAVSVGIGTQVSPVQINVAALSQGFKKDIVDIIRMNIPYVLGTLALIVVLTFFIG
ncbi:hypothetical protein [Melaminivora alkalimesophila]|uniref:hypothetical protein n=1 Tax=Melaminivora alkalimesophila TaxID=1165852 RepID=UPI0002F00865|nr:hypothetical protein [Melaminivora alkalimesophila]